LLDFAENVEGDLSSGGDQALFYRRRNSGVRIQNAERPSLTAVVQREL
jgi:hypothetical protein